MTFLVWTSAEVNSPVGQIKGIFRREGITFIVKSSHKFLINHLYNNMPCKKVNRSNTGNPFCLIHLQSSYVKATNRNMKRRSLRLSNGLVIGTPSCQFLIYDWITDRIRLCSEIRVQANCSLINSHDLKRLYLPHVRVVICSCPCIFISAHLRLL